MNPLGLTTHHTENIKMVLKLFFSFLDMSILNADILHDFAKNSKTSLLQFCNSNNKNSTANGRKMMVFEKRMLISSTGHSNVITSLRKALSNIVKKRIS